MVDSEKKQIILRGHGVVEGITEGEAIVTTQAFAFPHGVDPKTGIVTDVRHELKGENIAGRILVYPQGRGSTTGDLWMLELTRCGKSAAAIINVETDPITVTGAILSRLTYGTTIPIIEKLDRNPIDIIKTGDYIRVDANRGTVEVLDKKHQAHKSDRKS